MDMTWARVAFTICVFISFMLVLLIVTSRRNKANYDDAAKSIVDDPDTPQTPPKSNLDNGVK
ncbi:MAG: CcoQ/FixQ family Cbb3-type cytochrome c oxidase assembly chaperone [Alysiella sp.]|uniref:cbb3-type cytochrome oxidase subunit 3 n=1 Tax=Alysiella sp. TaxID=1872483 RepID=UPI0026DA8AB0|nr:CcoQ/FixQ family Cbb3-type cytochrome c oxidase assembly chaperone [Alysiella sp.]MDO4433416.1 CcoQ/FixQ family Cbb3-type cytochrome c oxidase assembly chaperone [Alysiella sp.]